METEPSLVAFIDKLYLAVVEEAAGVDPYREEKPRRKWGPCIICSRRLYRDLQDRRTIPDYLCHGCFELWKDHLYAPWMKRLQHDERYRRLKIQRRIIHLEKTRRDARVRFIGAPC
jgi:hypothetical protein